jgi:hypothetical protein
VRGWGLKETEKVGWETEVGERVNLINTHGGSQARKFSGGSQEVLFPCYPCTWLPYRE